jgi:hypothetical protein
MLKISFIAIVFFVLGVGVAELYSADANLVDHVSNTTSDAAPMPAGSELVSDTSATAKSNNDKPAKKTPKFDLNNFQKPKTPFDFYKVLLALESSSAAELEGYISSMGRDKPEVRNQAVWLLAAKYPNDAIDFLTTVMNRGDVDLAKVLLRCVGQNHANLAWEWVKVNESELDKVFNNVAEKYEFKLFVLNMLALNPEQKWAAYEEAQAVIVNGPRKVDKYNLLAVAINAASVDPEDAINRSISNANGNRDPVLFDGALGAIIEKDLSRARDLVLQNQDLAEGGTVSKVAYSLMQNNRFSEAYGLVNSLTNNALKSAAVGAIGERAINNGLDRAKEFANAIVSDELRHDSVKSMVNLMDVSGQPIKDQVALLDSALQKTPADTKAFDYAYTMRDWSRKNNAEFNAYMSDLRSRDKTFADQVEKTFQYFQKK